MSLGERLRAQIAATGPMTVAQYMTACLLDPRDGYYATRPALGAEGDFLTAPLVSQVFGELLGLWCAAAWEGLGRPGRVRLIEVGPGDGTLLVDALRALRAAPGLLAAAELVLVEPSPVLATRQRTRLADAPCLTRWVGSLLELEPGPPVLLLANEVLDCLPVRQFLRTRTGWAERLVGLGPDGGLAFGLAALPAGQGPDAPEGAVWETAAMQAGFAAEVAGLVAADGGAALLVDYGRAEPGLGDTLQALRMHERVDPLACPGEADLTVHADFPTVLAAARDAGAAAYGPITQAELLGRLGVEARFEALARAAPDREATLQRQFARLTAPDQMGTLFKAVAIGQRGAPVPPAFG